MPPNSRRRRQQNVRDARRRANAGQYAKKSSRGRRGRTSGPSSSGQSPGNRTSAKSGRIYERDLAAKQRQIDNENLLKVFGITPVQFGQSADADLRATQDLVSNIRMQRGVAPKSILEPPKGGKPKSVVSTNSSEPKNVSQDVSKTMGAKIAREATEEAIEAAYGRVKSRAGGKSGTRRYDRDSKGRFA